MKIPHPKLINLIVLVFALFSTFSCSKDMDLLADYVVADYQEARLTGNILVNDSYFISGNETIVLDVLDNDIIPNPDKVKIVETSQPENGSVIINEDKTLTYVPDGASETSQTENPETTTQQEPVVQEETETTQAPVEEQSEPQEEASTQTPIEEQPETQQETENAQQPQTGQEPEDQEEKEEPVEEEKETTDTFTYTTETEEEDGSKTTEEATVTVTSGYGELKAFPSAEGFGKNATGGRGGIVIEVTNLNDSGPGSFRAAIDQVGVRTIVFNVAGTINLKSKIILSWDEGDVTIAGETAPFPGITLKNFEMEIRGSNVIMRYLSFRVDDDNSSDQDSIRILNVGGHGVQENIILDHLSISHGSDENFSIDGKTVTESVQKVTVQHCLLGMGSTVYNVLFGSHLYDVTFYGNYLAQTERRNILMGYGVADETLEFINNVIYGYVGGATVAYGNNVDFMGNIWKTFDGPKPTGSTIGYGVNKYNNPNAVESDGSIYVTDNFLLNGSPYNLYQSTVNTYKKPSRVITNSLIDTWATKVPDIEDTVFSANPGNSLQMDALDEDLIASYGTTTGSFYSLDVPSKSFTQRPVGYDSDMDGIEDSWEGNINGVVGNLDNNNDHDGDGYTNLEEFLHYKAAGN